MRKVFIVCIVILMGIFASQYPKLQIATGYAAKAFASGIFVCNRDSQSIVDNDLNYSIVKYTKSTIDYKTKTVRSTIFGFSPSIAVYRPGFGCALVHDSAVDKVGNQRFVLSESLLAEQKGFALPISDYLLSEAQQMQLDNAVDYAFNQFKGSEKGTASVLVVYKNKIVAEKYATGFDQNTRLWGWSMNKSIISAMIGLLSDEGQLDIMHQAPVKEWQLDDRKHISINDLLHMSSGLDWEEEYGKVSTATKMLYMEDDCYASAIDVPVRTLPNEEWYYSSGSTNVLSGIIRNTINNDAHYWNLPYERIFAPLGMKSMVYETDPSGYFVGSSHGYCTTRDWARFGLLYLNDGVCNGKRILSKDWIEYTQTPALVSNDGYGAQFWLNKNNSMPDVPTDTYGCYGHRGQRVFIIPSKDLVVVRLGFSQDHFDFNEFLAPIAASFPTESF